MRILLLLLIAAALSFTTLAAEKSFVGKYRCEGMNDAGKLVVFDLEIQTHEDAFHLDWYYDGNQLMYEGFGIQVGDHLSTTFYDERGGSALAIYKLEEGGALTGKWTAGDGKIHVEACFTPGQKA